jgi:serine/threonine-protein kinase
MITGSGEVKVMDFGIARSLADTGVTLTQTAAVVGTAQYISPEQARGEQADARSDLYSTGCVLYELLTGRPPFVGDSLVSVAVSHVREMPTPPSALDPSITRDIDAIAMKALAKDRLDRYQSAYEMRTDLERAAAGLPVAAAHDTSAATQLIAPAAAGYDGYATATALDQVPDEEEFEPEPRGMTWRKLVLAALAILAVAALIGYLAFRGDDGGGQQARVPDIVGATLEEAQVLIEGRGLVMGTPVEQPTTDADEIGIVLSQDPAFNTTVEPGSTVTPTVGVEPEPVTVPANLVGMTQEEAEAAIVAAGLTVGEVTPDEDSDEEPGTVTATDPASGEQVPPGTAVNLAVARAPELVAVPSVIGRSLEDARAAIEGAGLVLGNVESRESDRPQNEVLETDPAGGTEVDLGSTVNVAISAGQATVEVPDVTGQQQGAAEATLRQQGFTVIAQQETTCDENQGVVFAQDPEAGSEVSQGANVVIRVAEPPPQGCDD